MTITQTVDIPVNRRLTIDVPPQIPVGKTILAFTPVTLEANAASSGKEADSTPLPGGNARTIEEALQMAAEKAADPNRKPISRLFGKHKGIFGGDGVAYQRAIRDEWD